MTGATLRAAALAAAVVAVLWACADVPTGPTLAASRGGRPVQETILELVVVATPDSAPLGVPMQLCDFPRFANGAVGLAAVDAARCGAVYVATFTATQREVSRRQRAVLDTLSRTTWTATLEPEP